MRGRDCRQRQQGWYTAEYLYILKLLCFVLDMFKVVGQYMSPVRVNCAEMFNETSLDLLTIIFLYRRGKGLQEQLQDLRAALAAKRS